MDEQWHYAQDGKPTGPISFAQLKELASSGQLKHTDMVWKEGKPNWIPAKNVKDLFPPIRGTVPPPLPPPPPPVVPPIPSDPLSFLNAPVVAGYHRQRFAIAALSGAGMLATFLPWVHAPIIGAISGAYGDGWITLALFIPAMAQALRGQKLEPLIGNDRLKAVIPAGIAGFMALLKMRDIKSRISNVGRDNPLTEAMASNVQIGIGLYLLVGAAVALIVVAWLLSEQPNEGAGHAKG